MRTLTLVPEKTALVVIDLQKGIVTLPGAPNATSQVVNNAAKLADTFRANGMYVVLVTVGFTDGREMLRPLTDAPASQPISRPADWSELVPQLNVQTSDHLLTKRQWGAFFGTDLDLQLRRRGIDTIVLCGISTNIGVETTAREAYQLGYHQIFAIDAMTALSAEEHNHTIQYIFPRVGKIRTTTEVLSSLEGTK